MKNSFLPYILFVAVLTASRFVAQPIGCQAFKSSQIPIYYSAENLRSDTFDVLNYTISLTIGNTSNQTIGGNAKIRFAPKQNNRSFIFFDLLQLGVDSVKENNALLSYTYVSPRLKINFITPKNTTDTSIITVYYKGQPVTDATWGGFYFDNTQGAEYAYNMGVGFAAAPHNFGRVWFPCFDNFVEKSKYQFVITCDSTRRSYCGGALVSDVVNGTNRTRTWVLNEEIPTYLASVTVANYTKVNWTVSSLSGTKPIDLVAFAGDTTALKNGFVNLKNCFTGFENYFGPYRWNRVGYCVTPFSAGAMEHATNITYPKPFLGNLAYEGSLMAHELSHHWWGDLVTCETQEDMWINEGMATFSGFLFLEWQYGKKRYLDAVKQEHDDLLHFLHKREGGFRAISGVPHSLTYGSHVYDKGAIVAHTLRSYMGDNAFFTACKYLMTQRAFKNVNSSEMRNLFQTSSGQSLNDFFTNWVFSGGWPHFAVDSVKYTALNNGSVTAMVHVKQKLYGAPALYNNVPLDITFFKSDWSKSVQSFTMSGATGTFSVTLPFSPAMYALNYDAKISDASSHEARVIKSAANQNYLLGKVYVKVTSSGADSSLLRVVHNYVRPDGFKTNPGNHRLSNQHFWKLEGLLCNGFDGTLRFNYDGTKGNAGTYTYLDTALTAFNGDSIGLFFRRNAAQDWVWLKQAAKTKTGSKTGFFETDSIRLGEYAFGNVGDTSTVGLTKNQVNRDLRVEIFPNPARGSFTLRSGNTTFKDCDVVLLDVTGRVVLRKSVQGQQAQIETAALSPGNYIFKLEAKTGTIYSQSLLIE